MKGRNRSARARWLAAALLAATLATPSVAVAEPRPFYYWPNRVGNWTFDLLVVRTAAFLTVCAGAALVGPVVILTSPNGIDSIEEAWERFITAPGENLWGRPLGEL